MSKAIDEQKVEFEKMLNGYRVTDVLCSGVEVGVFEAIGGKSRTAGKLAEKLDADKRGISILLCALAGMGLLEKKNKSFSLSPVSERFLLPDSPEFMGDMVLHVANIRRAWMELSTSVKEGKPVPRKAGSKAEQKTRTRNFIMAMANASGDAATQLAKALDLDNVEKVLDVGGGPGTYLFEILKAVPGASGAVFDLPATLEITKDMIKESGLSARQVAGLPGDFIKDLLPEGYDLMLMSSIVHIYGPEENQALVKKAYKSLNPGGQLVIKDFLLDPDRTSPLPAALFAVNMLVNTDTGNSYTEEEISSWMKSAGFKDIKRTDLPPRSSIITGVKPDKKKAARKKGANK